jgi:hypothetical protein
MVYVWLFFLCVGLIEWLAVELSQRKLVEMGAH